MGCRDTEQRSGNFTPIIIIMDAGPDETPNLLFTCISDRVPFVRTFQTMIIEIRIRIRRLVIIPFFCENAP